MFIETKNEYTKILSPGNNCLTTFSNTCWFVVVDNTFCVFNMF